MVSRTGGSALGGELVETTEEPTLGCPVWSTADRLICLIASPASACHSLLRKHMCATEA